MKPSLREIYLRDALAALVRFYGFHAVTDALTALETPSSKSKNVRAVKTKRDESGIPRAILALHEMDPPRYDLLRSFFASVQLGEVLVEAEDVRIFAEIAGLKELRGRSRRDLVPRLAEYLATLPVEELSSILAKASGVSSRERNQGFATITDRMMRGV